MRLKLNIGVKIGLGFTFLIFAFIINSLLTNNTLKRSIEANKKITEIYNPSVTYLTDLQGLVNDTKMLIRSWVFIDKKKDTPDKLRLKEIHESIFPELDEKLTKLSEYWDSEDRQLYSQIAKSIEDTLFPQHQSIMEQLVEFSDYDDPMKMFLIIPSVEEGGEIVEYTDKIYNQLTSLIESNREISDNARAEMDQTFSNFVKFIIYAAIVLIFIAFFIALITIRSLAKPINYVKNILLEMARGILPKDKIKEGGDEIGQMSAALNKFIQALKDISNFAQEVGKGNFNSDFKPLSNEDILGNSLLDMREELRKAAAEEEKRKIEDAQRNWATQGIAKFAEILRQNNDNMGELSYNIISNLVKYMGANQGGLFLINNNDENDVFIELNACYAYDRRKYLAKRIEINEGLIGRCVQEKETIYLTEIPNDYIKITSGLGEDNPRSLLLVPLSVNEEIFGVIEVASFKEIEAYQVEFVEKIGESIASTISTVKINIKTQYLLEQSRQQTEEMHAQEEEMRQNLEELRATQEQSMRREEELRKALAELKSQKDRKS